MLGGFAGRLLLDLSDATVSCRNEVPEEKK